MTPPQAPPPPQKKSNLLLWILLGVGGLVALLVIGTVATGFFVLHKVKQAGFDPELMSKNPSLAVAKMVTAANPDIEVLSIDEQGGYIKVKDKKTGKVMEMNFEDAKQGKFVFREDGGKGASVTIGGDAEKVPEWVRVFPGAKVQSSVAANANEGAGGNLTFTVSKSPKEVADFYRDKLKADGFTIVNEFSGGGAEAGSMITAENKANRRTVHVVIGSSGSDCTVNLSYGEQAAKE